MLSVNNINNTNNRTFAHFQVPNLRYDRVNKELNAKEKSKIALGAFCGAIAPVIILNALKKGRVNQIVESFKNKLPFKDKFKAIWNMLEIDSFTEILATTVGGITGGLLGGLKYAKNKEEKEAKYKEGIFEFLNNMTPTTLVAIGLNHLKKIQKDKSVPLQAGVILGSVVGGMFIANKASNKINEKIFDKDKEQKDIRNFKPTDCLVHMDDLVNLAVLAKIPLASKFQVDKLLPLIYSRAGYEVGVATPKKEQK